VVRVAGAGRAASMSTVNAQPGIFALGTPEHAYLEFDLAPGTPPVELVRAAAGLVDPLSTTGGVNLVIGFRPELWAEVADPADVPGSTQGWAEPLVGPDGWSMPATQQDAFLWVAGGNRTAVFDNGRAVVRALVPVARLCRETDGWTYRHDRDLNGFIDGTENPSLLTAPAVALVPAGQPGAGSSARPGPGDLPPQHRHRHPLRARHRVRQVQRRAGVAGGDAAPDGRSRRRHPRRADPLHPPGHRGLLHRALR
jgi:hypothetical protein